MGNCCLPIRLHRSSSAVYPKNVTLLLVGLDKSGKTTIAKRLAGEPIDSVVPTVGFSVVTLRQKGCRVSVYDLGGGPQIRDIWHRYYADAHGVIFVVDAIATDRMEECRHVLHNLLHNDQISGKPILLLANKQDIEGALDEIDIVDRLNLEKLVNERKCPTLVELCSALYFSKKIDVGIDNGYKWLIRSIIRDYPSLNNRVLKDLAKHEEENKVQRIIKMKNGPDKDDVMVNDIKNDPLLDPFKPVQKILEENSHRNGITEITTYLEREASKIPGLVDDPSERLKENKIKIRKFLNDDSYADEEPRVNSFSTEFFLVDKFQSDIELLNDVPNQKLKNFLVRPKSSGARLYGIRPERKKSHKRKGFLRGNKTGPGPFTSIAHDQKPQMRNNSSQTPQYSLESASFSPSSEYGWNAKKSKTFLENSNPFLASNHVADNRKSDSNYEFKVFRDSKSTPHSRKNSIDLENSMRRKHTIAGLKMADGFVKAEKMSPLKVNNRLNNHKEIILNVSQLRHLEEMGIQSFHEN